MTTPKLPSVVDSTGVARLVRGPSPTRREHFTAEGVQSAGGLATQLSRLQKVVADAHRAALANPFAQTTVFEGIAMGSGGAQHTFKHQLGRAARWTVVGWRGATAGPSLVEVSRDASTLVLASYVAGTADVMVF